MRMFIAVDLNEDARKRISGITEGLKSKGFDVRWVNPENIHITLKFLGEVNEDSVKDIEGIISRAVKDVKRFMINIMECGYFGRGNHVKVIWLDVHEGRERLVGLARILNKELAGIRREDHEPSPHITIGRARSGRNVQGLIDEIAKLKHVKIGEVEVKEIKLKESVLRTDGPVYSDYRTFSLQ